MSKTRKTKEENEKNSEEEKKVTYSDDVIKKQLGKYGVVYFPSEIKDYINTIVGCDVQKERLSDFFKALKKYDEFEEQLKKANLSPNLTILLYGPPGTGKTTLTRAFAKEYDIPVCVVESYRLVSSLLGDTVKNITAVIDLAADIAKERGAFILFFDEIDAVGSERSNIHEVGEIKRAVISFLQAIDRINYEGYPLAIIGATNHQHQLDSAIWRRFTFHLSFEFPDFKLRKLIIESFLNKVKLTKIGIDKAIQIKLDDELKKIQTIQQELEKKLNRNLSEFNDEIFWNEIEKNNSINGLLKLTHGYSGSDIERGIRVALFKIIYTELLTYDLFYNSLKLVGGTALHVDTQYELSNLRKESNKKGQIKNAKGASNGPPEI
jgi:SpoVK/Ycf46/Vps4 family AAA+-type ATPase